LTIFDVGILSRFQLTTNPMFAELAATNANFGLWEEPEFQNSVHKFSCTTYFGAVRLQPFLTPFLTVKEADA
jgi:hypothetical protein